MSDSVSAPDSDTRSATLYGIGVGPGDPELMTVKALRLIEQCDVIGYIANADGHSMARTIAADAISQRQQDPATELAVRFTMSRNRTLINAAYDAAAQRISEHLKAGLDVGFLCEGDPLFFGSFAYLAQRLCDDHRIQIVPGISSIMAGTALTGRSLGLQSENLAIISGRHEAPTIAATLAQFNNVAIMKVGTKRAQIKQLIAAAGRTEDACYIEHIGFDEQRIVHDVATLDDTPGPYFSLFLINQSRDTHMNHDRTAPPDVPHG